MNLQKKRTTISEKLSDDIHPIFNMRSISLKNKFNLETKSFQIESTKDKPDLMEYSNLRLIDKIHHLKTKNLENPFQDKPKSTLTTPINRRVSFGKYNETTKMTKFHDLNEDNEDLDSFMLEAKKYQTGELRFEVDHVLGSKWEESGFSSSYSREKRIGVTKELKQQQEDIEVEEEVSMEEESIDTIVNCLKDIQDGKIYSSVLGNKGSYRTKNAVKLEREFNYQYDRENDFRILKDRIGK